MHEGYIKLYRKIIKSKIWNKPSDWLKIWVHILITVNHKDNKLFKRGENYFNYNEISRECRVKYNVIVNCVSFLKRARQVATRKTTHGIVISVLNYDKYHDPQGNTESNTESNTKATLKQHRSHTINKNNKNEKNIKNKQKNFLHLLPTTLCNDSFKKVWVEWCDFRRQKKAITEVAAKRQLKKLAELDDLQLAKEAIDYSITNDYQGLFVEKYKKGGRNAEIDTSKI